MPITNLPQFNLEIDHFTKDLPPKLAGMALRKIGLEALRGVIQLTPVDTGRAKGNWQVQINASPTGETGLIDDSVSDFDPGESPAYIIGANVIATAPPYSAIHIGNNVPYIGALENGHSKQAPLGMVALTFARLQAHYGNGDALEGSEAELV